MIRSFKLYNAENDLIDLLENTDFFGANPEGLGVSFEHSFYEANANFKRSNSILSQVPFTIEVYFGAKTKKAYERYDEFIGFLNKPPYRLEYETNAGKWSRDYVLNELTKTEITKAGTMIEQVVLLPSTPFYRKRTEKTDIVADQPGDGKIYVEFEVEQRPSGVSLSYDYIYDYVYFSPPEKTPETVHGYAYPYIYEGHYGGRNGVFVIDNGSRYLGSSQGSPVEIEITGPALNPYWEVVQGSKILQDDGFNLDVPGGYKLIVSSLPGNQKAILVAPDGTESNIYQQQDLSKSNFVTLPVGRSQLIFHNCEFIRFTYREESVTV